MGQFWNITDENNYVERILKTFQDCAMGFAEIGGLNDRKSEWHQQVRDGWCFWGMGQIFSKKIFFRKDTEFCIGIFFYSNNSMWKMPKMININEE